MGRWPLRLNPYGRDYTNAAVARDAKQMLATKMGWKEYFTTSTSCVDLLKTASF